MISFKGILKYLTYLCIAGWMFFLGIMVGRGSSPVTFDTRAFQKRLEMIANEFGGKKETSQKMDLKFYDVLDSPVPEEPLLSKHKILEIVPATEMPEKAAVDNKTSANTIPGTKIADAQLQEEQMGESAVSEARDVIPEKTSKKRATFKMKEKGTGDNKEMNAPGTGPGKYTIQVAAYKEFIDAVSQMALLAEKGFSSYRVKSENNGVALYRVRIGSFSTWDEAETMKEKLKKAKIKSMIIRKDDDENIKG